MSIEYDFLVVVDIESTCWENHNTPRGEQTEIIEVGICLLNLETRQPTAKQSLLIQPTRSKVSPFCTQLTSITPEMVAGGMSFADACATIEIDYLAPQRIWASWGEYDRRRFTNQCRSFDVDYPFSDHHINLKQRFADLHKINRVGMREAIDMADLAFEGTHHRGADDAWNIAQLAAYMLGKFGQEATLKPTISN